jgi:NAD(P)-dependent dehydrogenase (short-subunit alcohol dehydrogenase family)
VQRIARTTRFVFSVNVDGVFNTVLPLVDPMRSRGNGHVVILSSCAGYGALGSEGLAYCSSKAAVRVWGDGLRMLLRPHGVRVTVVTPGFIRTAMTDAFSGPQPFKIELQDAIAGARWQNDESFA